MTPPTRPLLRKEASKYLFEMHGIRRTPGTLAKLACIGGGPIYRKAGRSPLYEPSQLDQWAFDITSGPLRSTSQLAETGSRST